MVKLNVKREEKTHSIKQPNIQMFNN